MNSTDFTDETEIEQAQQERLKSIYEAVVKTRDKWIAARAASGVEGRWRTAQRLYEGKDAGAEDSAMVDALRNGPSKRRSGAQRSRVSINIVAPKVEAVTARLCEILLPIDDKNWGVKPRPNHKLAKDAQTPGTLVDPVSGQEVGKLSEVAQSVRESYKQAAAAMENQIDDVLTACNYNGEQRRMIEDACRLGTGVLKGPRPYIQSDCTYQQVAGKDGSMAFAEIETEETRPGSERIDPWNVFPDPACGNNHQRGSGIWEMRDITRRELRELIGMPGFLSEEIADILAEDPKRVSAAEGRVQRVTSEDGAYQQWEYHGEIEAKDFSFLREASGNPLQEAMSVEQCVLIVVNDRIIGALKRWTRDLPYDFFNWWPRDDSPFGDGMPHRLHNAQRVVTAAWRQLMDNAGLSSGGQVVVLRSLVEPQDGDWQMAPRKVWVGKDDLDDARKAFATFEFASHTEELLKIVETAMEMADRESNTPLLMQGDQGAAPDNVGGTLALFAAANSPLRHRVKLFDDAITEPHIKRYYRWFMSQADGDGKGDFEVDARGSSVLVERDAQSMAMMQVAALAQSPIYGPLMAEKALSGLRAILKSFKLNPDDWVATEEEDAQKKEQAKTNPPPPPPPEPAVQVAQIKAQDAEAARQAQRERDALIHQERVADVAYNSARESNEFQIAQAQEENKRYLALTALAQERELNTAELAEKSALERLKIADGRDRFQAEIAIKNKFGQGI